MDDYGFYSNAEISQDAMQKIIGHSASRDSPVKRRVWQRT
jgi:hypothetical protein